MNKHPDNRNPRKPSSAKEREAEHQAKVRAKKAERVADAAILRHLFGGFTHQPPDLYSTINNDQRLVGDVAPQLAELVDLRPELLTAARAVLQGRIELANEQHTKTIGTKSEETSESTTRSASQTLRGAIKQIDRESSLRSSN